VIDFYPTPKSLAMSMLSGVDWKLVSTVLEPSAGKGDLVDMIHTLSGGHDAWGDRRRSKQVDCIEIDPDLRHVLKGKGYPVIHDDFLTFRSPKHYDLIVANFPFSEGDRHLQHALTLMEENGGTLIALVNAETIRNPYTRLRQSVVDTLNIKGASIDYWAGMFVDAERPTDVEVALVKVQIERPTKVSFLLGNMRQEQDWRSDPDTPDDLVSDNPILAMVERFNLEARAGLSLVDEYLALRPYMLDTVLTGNKDNDQHAHSILKLSVGDSHNNYGHGDAGLANDYIVSLRKKYWSALLRHPRFRDTYTSNILDELERQLGRMEDYDFTLFNIMELEAELRSKITSGVEDAIMDMFATFTDRYAYHDWNSNVHYYNGWRTNKSHVINRRVIVPINGSNAYSWDKNRFDSYRIAKEIGDLVKAFDYLAGESRFGDMWASALDRIKEFGPLTRNVDFGYFWATFYKKGTCHIEFRDMNLLAKLNIYGSQKKNWLPPSYGKRRYRDMDPEEQAVVDSFQGEDSYDLVMDNADYFLTDPAQTTLALAG
jgi:phospholipid N-methyltransferase